MFTSKNTVIKHKTLPRIAKYIERAPNKGDFLLDFGAGLQDTQLKMKAHVAEKGWQYVGYDPGHGPRFIPGVDFRLIVCSNVLCVLRDEELDNTLNFIMSFDCDVMFTVYEGDKSGILKMTKPDCWQRNQPTKWYAKYLTKFKDYSISMKDKVIWATLH